MSNQPIVFNIGYTPYALARSATQKERAQHREERAFYDMTGTNNIYKYMTRKEKRLGVGKNVLDYFRKSTGVFNGRGMLSEKEVAAMQERAKRNKGNLWHGYISLNKEESHKIDTPEKCIALIRSTFGAFFRDMKFSSDNIDLMCALHKDRPHHLHIHFEFWEKEPKYKGKDGTLQYRSKGKIEKSVIDTMFVRLGVAISEKRDRLYKNRDAAIQELRQAAHVKNSMFNTETLKAEIISLAKVLPKTGRIAYASKNMEPYRAQVDKIVQMLLDCNPTARKADRRFYEALEKRKRMIENICGVTHLFSDKDTPMEKLESALPKYHNAIDSTSIRITEEIESDYKRRQGNLVLKLAKFIKPELSERQPGKKHKANDVRLKKRLTVARRIASKTVDSFLAAFGAESERLALESRNRLREIEQEIARERGDNQSDEGKEENYKY